MSDQDLTPDIEDAVGNVLHGREDDVAEDTEVHELHGRDEAEDDTEGHIKA